MHTVPLLSRVVSQTSRALEFFSEPELTMQIGFPRAQWPLALLKELVDNGLDACETAGVMPAIAVRVDLDALSVSDNGPGLPRALLERSLDYLMRVSDKAAYVSPTRGQLGNALKAVWAAPFVVDGTQGRVEVYTGGMRHQIDVTLDQIAQQPTIKLTTEENGFVKNGTCITMHWPGIASSLWGPTTGSFYNGADLLQRYAAFNPHATFSYTTPDGTTVHFPCTTSTWEKWLPSQATSPHWYTVERLQRLVLAYLAEDRRREHVRTVRELVAEFAGLSGTAKQQHVTTDADLGRATLEDLVRDERIDPGRVRALLTAMQAQSRPLNPARLGVLGEAHLQSMLVHQLGVAPASVKYKKYVGDTDAIPYVLELAFGWYAAPDPAQDAAQLLGFNWTPALRTPFPGLTALLGEARVDHWDSVVFVAHLACPRLEATDRGKTAVALPGPITAALQDGVRAVTKPWTALKRQADREERVRQRELDHWLKRQEEAPLNIKDAAWQVMAQAYLHASDAGALPANARQIMYSARPLVLALTGGQCWKDSAYFTQTLLPDFIEAHPELTAEWDVVYDARGHFQEPHTRYQLGLGTLEVREYLRSWRQTTDVMHTAPVLSPEVRTRGPAQRFQYALFIEKEGFNELLKAGQIEETYDLALMSTKGMTVIAARSMVEALSAAGVTILVVHDFDKAGLEILDKFTSDTRRHTYKTTPQVIDLGLRLAQVQAMRLQSEPVFYTSKVDPCAHLRRCGASQPECDFLVQGGVPGHWEGERIELNAMTSSQFLAWLKAALDAAGVTKVVPDAAALAAAYRAMSRVVLLQQTVDAAFTTLPAADTLPVPDGLADTIRAAITGSTQPWDAALWAHVWAERQPLQRRARRR